MRERDKVRRPGKAQRPGKASRGRARRAEAGQRERSHGYGPATEAVTDRPGTRDMGADMKAAERTSGLM